MPSNVIDLERYRTRQRPIAGGFYREQSWEPSTPLLLPKPFDELQTYQQIFIELSQEQHQRRRRLVVAMVFILFMFAIVFILIARQAIFA